MPHYPDGLGIAATALLGASIATYAMYVEYRLAAADAAGEEYEAPCDIKKGRLKGSSCSGVLSSKYGHILSYWRLVKKGSALDFSNGFLGLLYYAVVLSLAILPPYAAPPALLFAVTLGGLAFSGYLAFILKFVLRDFCVVCTSMYAVNAVLFVLSAVRLYGKGTAPPAGGTSGEL